MSSWRTVLFALSWCACSSALIVANKYILGSTLNFRFPIFLSGLELCVTPLVCGALYVTRSVALVHTPSWSFYARTVLPIGFLAAAKLALGNAAYIFLSVAYVNVLKAVTPCLTLCAAVCLGAERSPSYLKTFAVVLIAMGTTTASYGEPHFNAAGFALMLASESCEALKVVLMQLVFTDATSGLPLVESTFLFTTASTLCFLAFTLPYELRAMAATGGFAVIAQHPATFASVALLGAAVNFLSYGVIHSSSGVSFKVIGQAKNGALVVGSALFLGDPLSPVEITGYVASLAGVGLYTHAQSAEKAEARKLLGGGALDVAPERQQHGGTGQPAEEEAAGPQLEEDQFVDTSPVSLGWLGDLFCPCLPRTPFSQLVVLSASSIVAATGFSALQESVFSLPGFTFPSFVTFVTSGVYCLCGALEMMQTGELRVTSSWRDYAILASLTFTGMYLTNWALQYINYATRIVAKSSKVIPTMLVGVLLQGRTYSWTEYGAAALLVLGVSLFCLGDSHVAPNFSLRGIALIMAALFADAATSNWEEKRFFRIPVPVSNAEVIACSSLFSCAVSAAVMVATSELGPAWRYTTVNSHVVPLLVAASVSGYLSVSLVLLLIKHYGAANAETVKTLRKVITVIFSFVAFPKRITPFYFFGFAAMVCSLGVTARLHAGKHGAHPPSHAPARPAADKEADTEAS